MNRFARPLILAAVLALAGIVPVAAQPLDEIETFRADLLQYVAELEALPEPLLAEFQASGQSLADARTSIEAMSREEIAAIKVQMDRLPFWRGVPGMLSKALFQAAGPSPLDIAATAQARIETNAQLTRLTLRTMITHFRSIPAEQVHPGYQEEVNRLEAMIDQATPEQLIQLDRELSVHLERWNQQLGSARTSAGVVPGEGVVTEMNHCGSSFPGAIICGMEHLFNDIVAFFNALPGYATEAFNKITDFFGDLIGDIPTSFGGIVNSLGLSNVNWNHVAQTALDYARLPCPEDGFLLPAFGEVGELRTFTNFSGTIGFAGNVIKDLTPSDVLTSVNLQAVMIVINFPIQWLSRCLEEAWDDNWETMQRAHVGLVAGKLDVLASSRVSQLSLDGGQAQVNDLDSDVASVEGKLDRLDSDLDRIEITTLRLDGKADDLEDKIDNLQVQQGETSEILDALRLHMLRMLLEQDLFGEAKFKIGLFQLPGTVGGFIEMAADIVRETIENRSAAGANVKNAVRDYNSGVQQHAAGNFKSAYELFRRAYSTAVN